MVADSFNALILGVYALILGPLGILRGPLLLERTFWYIWVLSPLGLLSRFVRVAINWRLGHFDVAISDVEDVITRLEEEFKAHKKNNSRRRILGDLYTLLTRALLHVGRMDDAMLVILRAKKTINIDRLPGLSQLNSKTAHLIRAGLSAGRLLDGGGLATLFVKAPIAEKPKSQKRLAISRKGASKSPDLASDSNDASDASAKKLEEERKKEGAKIIPFPVTFSPDRNT